MKKTCLSVPGYNAETLFFGSGALDRVRGEFTNDVSETAVSPIFTGHDSRPVKMGPTAVSETSSVNSPRTPCRNPKTKKTFIHSTTKV